jgi:Nucleotide modification associated domain 1
LQQFQAYKLLVCYKKSILRQTLHQYDQQSARCRLLFEAKTRDYGTAWRILRLSSLTDQLLIKARRIRTIEERGTQAIADPIADEYRGIVNYSVMALMQLDLGEGEIELPTDVAVGAYEKQLTTARTLMIAKNTDYGEVWRDMRLSSLTDLILMKLLRVRQLEDLKSGPEVSEGRDANYLDMINYALFALIKLDEQSK